MYGVYTFKLLTQRTPQSSRRFADRHLRDGELGDGPRGRERPVACLVDRHDADLILRDSERLEMGETSSQ